MMGCCGHFSALFRSKNESDLLFFHGSRLAIRAGGLLGVCWSCLLRSSSLLFFPCREVKLLLGYRGRGVKRRRMVRRTKAPALRAPACNFHTCHIHQQWEGTTPRATLDGHGGLPTRWKCSRSLPSRWRVITYILPKMRICSLCHIYTNSDLQGEYRWQVIRVRRHGDAGCSLLHF